MFLIPRDAARERIVVYFVTLKSKLPVPPAAAGVKKQQSGRLRAIRTNAISFQSKGFAIRFS
jgi:hypothetical protein